MKDTISLLKNAFVPCFCLSGITGILTGCLIFLFKVTSAFVISLSTDIFSAVRQAPEYLPLLILGAAAIGAVSAFILRYAKDCRGGGIPTAIAAIRGLIPIQWIQGVFGMFGVSLLTFLGGVPLGNEGPSVQMGAAVGKGVNTALGHSNQVWRRYVMTGGACAGFAAATCAPFTAIIFAMEEIHRRFSPLLFMAASSAVMSGIITQSILSYLFKIDIQMFSLEFVGHLTTRELPLMILLGIICAAVGTLFTVLYGRIRRAVNLISKRLGLILTVTSIFAVSAVFGFVSPNLIGSGHSVIHILTSGNMLWYSLILIFATRVIMMISANTAGVSGGVFLPTLAFGAILGALFAKAAISLGVIGEAAYPIIIASSMVTFWAVTARTPLSAIAFAVETLCPITALLPIIISVSVGYIAAEISGVDSFNDTIIESNVEHEYAGKTPLIIDAHLTVCENSFAVGHEVHEILWPPTCTVLSVDRKKFSPSSELQVGDVLHLHYSTYDTEESGDALRDILGEQPIEGKTHLGTDTHTVPFD